MNHSIIPSPVVSVNWLFENSNDPDLVILDGTIPKKTRNSSSLNNPKILNAYFFDLKKVFSDNTSLYPNTLPSVDHFEKEVRKLGINNHSKIVVYDQLGIYSSPRVCWMFHIMGHKNIAVLDGGLPKWIENNYPTQRDYQLPNKTGKFKAVFEEDKIVYLEKVKSIILSNSSVIADARSSGRFNGTSPEPREDLRSGHMPNSKNIPFTEVINNNCFIPDTEINQLFTSQIPDKNQRLIFSCGSGITACILYLAAHKVGYSDLAVYDGSWTEYAQQDLPIKIKNS